MRVCYNFLYMENYLGYVFMFLCGCAGAFSKDVIVDNALELPRKSLDRFILGFVGGMLVGGIAGLLVDGSPVTAFLAGYAGNSVIDNLLPRTVKVVSAGPETVRTMIERIAEASSVDKELAVKVAQCESGLDPSQVHKNSDGSVDRGLYQINSKWHSEVSENDAFDPEFSTRFFCKAVKDGHIAWWDATKQCWGK